jgi:hypothetical protein
MEPTTVHGQAWIADAMIDATEESMEDHVF